MITIESSTRGVGAVLLTVGALVAPQAWADAPLPPASFTTDVLVNGFSQCSGSINSSSDGICSFGSSFAHTDGGVPGTSGFDPTVAPGTHVGATALAPGVAAVADMTYLIQVNGPAAPNHQVAVDMFSTGLASVLNPSGTGQSFALVALSVTNEGSSRGALDPTKGMIIDSHFDDVSCSSAGCLQQGMAWSQPNALQGDHLCLTLGNEYLITIQASSSVAGMGTSAMASIDPQIVVDPVQLEASAGCFQPSNPSLYTIAVSPGASTGGTTSVPEPGILALSMLALLMLGLSRAGGRRMRAAAAAG